MKRWLCCILIISVLLTQFPLSAFAWDSTLYLPGDLTEVEEQAFEGNKAITSIVIPKSVQSIGSRAFADCTGLTDVYVGNNPTMQIATDAFAGCTGILFHVYPDSNGELFALSHGFRRELLEPGSPAWERTMAMIGEAGFSISHFNSPQWSSKRLIVRRSVDYLPDISAYNPKSIIEKSYNHIFVVQFDTAQDTEACHSLLLSDSNTVYAEEDLWHETDIVTSAGIVDSGVWGTDDPMGFELYSSFVKQNSSGSVKIAIIDSGVKQLSHYSSMLVDGKNMLEDIDGQSWSNDSVNHGSVIASIIRDCVGSNNVRIIPIRVLGSVGQLDDELMAAGIDYAVAKGASIINLSMSFPQSSVVRDAINHAVNNGVTVVVAAGNDARNVSGVFPANMSNVVTVSGISPGYKLSTWSNFGAIDYCAPDNYINTTAYSNSMRYTSFAAPMIASAYALVKLDAHHSLSDMNASCILTDDPSSFGKGLPQLHLLASVNATNITLTTKLPDKMKVGDAIDLSWTIIPANATNQTVTAVSSNPEVLECSGNSNGGLTLQAKGQGTAHVTLTVNGSTASVTTKDIVVEQPVTGITISGAPSKLIVGKTTSLSAMVTPSNATTKTYTWHSANNCASVDQNGIVTGLAAGTATVFVTADDGYGTESNRLSFPVVVQPDATSVDIFIDGISVKGSTVTMEPGATKTLTFSVLPSDAEQAVIFESLNTSVATIDDKGLITAKGVGTASILAIASTGSNIKATVTINVENPIVEPTSVSLTTSKNTIDIGETTTIVATVSPDDATDKTVTWTTSNASVATVSNGIVTGKTAGTVNITATTHNNKTGSITITVRQPVPEAPTLSSVTLNSSNTYVTVKWTTVSNATGYKVLYGTSTNISNADTKQVTGQSSSSTSISVDEGETYYFWVKAYNSSGDSLASSRKTVSVPEPCTLEVDETSWTPGYEEDVKYFIVTCESSFSVDCSKSWIDYSISGDEIEVWVDENTGSSKRTGYLYVVCDEHEEKVSIKITQDYNDEEPVADPPSISHYIQDNWLVVEWDSVPGASKYTYQWAYNSTSNITSEYTVRYTDVEHQLTDMNSGTWYIRVKAITDSGETSWSSWHSIRIN
ncbi:MAG: Ig-like domain-containing protein [Clostridia bacterium]|nr:Ig-like domain-containing protein [Clostridia bacterium]